MQYNEQHIKRYEEDEIDLKELAKTLLKYKTFIILFTIFVTLISLVYIFFKNPVPIYSGNTMVEIGVLKNKDTDFISMDNANDLVAIVNKELNVNASVAKPTRNLINITVNDRNKEKIAQKLKDAVDFIIQRHTEKAKFYDKSIMTKEIGTLVINKTPINKPKKKLIVSVAFVTGVILSIFLVFFVEFVRGLKNEDETVQKSVLIG